MNELLKKLSETDKQKLLATLAKVYPADDANCKFLRGRLYDDETQIMKLDINYIASKTATVPDSANANTILSKALSLATPQAVENFNTDLQLFLKHSIGEIKLIQDFTFSMGDEGTVFLVTFETETSYKLKTE